MRRAAAIVAAIVLAIGLSGGATAHPGGTDVNGCHMDRKAGTRHCHGGKPAPARGSGSLPDFARLKGAQRAPFANCAAARAAGAAPVRRGDPGYSPRLDRDGDGVGCER